MTETGLRYRKLGTKIMLEGTIRNLRIPLVTRLPHGFRPVRDSEFRVQTALGYGTVKIRSDGSVIANPKDGWIKFDGINFPME
jgi:hypothetical protein